MTRRIARPWLQLALPGALVALLFLAHASGALAAPAPKSTKRLAKKSTASSRRPVRATTASVRVPGSAGMRAFIDPVTGRLTRPTVDDAHPVEAQALVRPAPEDDPTRGLSEVPLAGGGAMVRLDERFQEYELAKVGSDGKVTRDCVHGTDGLAKARKAAPAPAREVK
jgi:hypothetical protein